MDSIFTKPNENQFHQFILAMSTDMLIVQPCSLHQNIRSFYLRTPLFLITILFSEYT